MEVNYKDSKQSTGSSKILKIVGWFAFIGGIIWLISEIISLTDWNEKKDNYVKQYVYSEYGTLYYEVNGERIYVQSIYNTENEKISLDIPNNKFIIMYIDKNNINEGIYINLGNTNDSNILSPIFSTFAAFFTIAMGVLCILESKKEKEKNVKKKQLILTCVVLFFSCILLMILQVNKFVNYLKLKHENNITTATIYSEIYDYDTGERNNRYKPVSYYYVDDKKYLYVEDSYVEGNLKDNIGKKFELYYNKNNPSEAAKQESFVKILFVIVGVCFFVFAFIFIFFKYVMGKFFNKCDKLNKQL